MSAPESTPTNNQNDSPANARRSTLLIIDDEESVRQSLCAIFKDRYELLVAPNGATAIELAQAHDVDVAVCDIRMPGMSGIEVLERLKFVNPAIEVVMLTAFETTETMRQALRLRACDYLNKPFDVHTIRDAVKRALEKHTLDNEVSHNTEQLQALLSELQNHKISEQIAQTRGDIYVSMIHDINGPLTSISGFVEVLNRRVGRASHLEAADLEFIKDRLKVVTRQVTNCIEISRRYLSFIRRQPDEVPRVGLQQVFTQLEHLLHLHPSLLHNQFTLHPPAEDVGVKIHGVDLIQILLHLAVNAFQCSPRGCQVDITAEVLNHPLELEARTEGPADSWLNLEHFTNAAPLVRVSVRDAGPGILPEILPRIFQPYFSTKTARQGTGLGLSIVQRLIRGAEAAIHVHTCVGQGTTFSLYVPATPLAK